MTKNRRGKWAGFPATVVAALADIPLSRAKRLLPALRIQLDRDLEISDVGHLIYEQWRYREEGSVVAYLSRV